MNYICGHIISQAFPKQNQRKGRLKRFQTAFLCLSVSQKKQWLTTTYSILSV
nr:MAG TPA: hypothetical protein [Caudoviricetes sp.]